MVADGGGGTMNSFYESQSAGGFGFWILELALEFGREVRADFKKLDCVETYVAAYERGIGPYGEPTLLNLGTLINNHILKLILIRET